MCPCMLMAKNHALNNECAAHVPNIERAPNNDIVSILFCNFSLHTLHCVLSSCEWLRPAIEVRHDNTRKANQLWKHPWTSSLQTPLDSASWGVAQPSCQYGHVRDSYAVYAECVAMVCVAVVDQTWQKHLWSVEYTYCPHGWCICLARSPKTIANRGRHCMPGYRGQRHLFLLLTKEGPTCNSTYAQEYQYRMQGSRQWTFPLHPTT